ncbi:MAG: PAS domain-containing protein, partial [Bdellovibrionales bacterium]|nr:PAS domain-containing protein [Bdellovibrionales bacterium]
EHFEKITHPPRLQIFATDISEKSLTTARIGSYSKEAVQTLSAERLSKFFHPKGDHFEINRFIREMITFSSHNLLADPPFSRLDLITCRNVLIYFEPSAQQRVLEMFHFALNSNGYLLLGSSETVGRRTNGFEPVSQKSRIYRPIGVNKSGFYQNLRWTSSYSKPDWTARPTQVKDSTQNLLRMIEQTILSRYAWACVAVDETLAIQSFYGPTSDYLTQPTGEARMDVLSWVKPGLYSGLSSALEKVKATGAPVTVDNIQIERKEQNVLIECRVELLRHFEEGHRIFLVAFRDAPVAPAQGPTDGAEATQPLAKQLEAELKRTRKEMHAIIDQLENANEEHRASHEELLSLNEELQSSNEELEATKEELQSLNEELVTVNQQLQDKNIQLSQAASDLTNLLSSAEIPIIFLDRNLRIRQFTPVSTALMRLVPSDIGRSIQHIKVRFSDENLEDDAKRVLDSLSPVTAEIESEKGRFYIRKILPYRTEENRIEGVCVTFHDITEQRKSERRVADAKAYAEAIIATVRTCLIVLNSKFEVVTVNDAFCDLFKVNRNQVESTVLFDLGNG